MKGITNIKNDDRIVDNSPMSFILILNNNYESYSETFNNRNYISFDLPNSIKKEYTTIKIIRTECGGLDESDGIRDPKCIARIHWPWKGSYSNISHGLDYYDGEPIYTQDISNIDWEENGSELIGISGDYNTLAKVYFELS